MGELLRTGWSGVSSVGGKCLFLCIPNAGCKPPSQVVFPHSPFREEKQGIIFPWEIQSVWGFLHLLMLEAPGGTKCEETAWNGAGGALSVSVVLPSGSSRVRIKAGWGDDKAVLLQLLRFQSLFWFSIAAKGKALNAVCNISVCWNSSFWTAWVRTSQVAARCKMAGDSFVLEEQRLGCILFAPASFFNTALLASEKMTFLLCWPKKAT